ncbi:hypothetical protein M378DRAFT_10966 [Amanita muscaria Koide BX008]|uniref:Uncharacterized protein n=1 Tax=Amanita muscaria (strain Koide BX008) TaxID=946122 RepID=A0A0C2TE34_AMAMK|nr:hypothetical protein M378DRAFT_10966 [Amanita muscaria Koide BX008]
MDFPKLVALDTDGTIWEGRLDEESWGKGHGASDPIEDNIERVDYSLLRDKTNHQKSIRVYNGISDVISDILKNGALLAIVSSNTSKALHDKALSHFVATNPKDGNEWSIVQLAKYHQVSNESKVEHFRKIKESSGIDYSGMILYDDEAMNNAVRIRLGVTFQAISHGKGLTWDIYREGLDSWRRAKRIAIPPNPMSQPTPMIIGYTGQSRPVIDLIRRGEGRVHRAWTCRWGFGLYVTDHPGIAKFYSDWEKREGREGWVCAVWVRDYDAWMNRVSKIWIPEIDVGLPQMDNRRASEEETGWNQENRDRAIADRWGVYTPYVLFSRHRFLDGMPIALKERSNEMLLPTQIQRSLFYLTEISDAEAEQTGQTLIPLHYHLQTKTWNIAVPEETKQDFLKHGETVIYDSTVTE